jgi:hypothetical protein
MDNFLKTSLLYRSMADYIRKDTHHFLIRIVLSDTVPHHFAGSGCAAFIREMNPHPDPTHYQGLFWILNKHF